MTLDGSLCDSLWQRNTALNQLTVRGFDKQLERRLRELAERRGVSLNRAALELMRRGAGLLDSEANSSSVGSALDTFINTWSEEDEIELRQAVEPFEQIDPELWR